MHTDFKIVIPYPQWKLDQLGYSTYGQLPLPLVLEILLISKVS